MHIGGDRIAGRRTSLHSYLTFLILLCVLPLLALSVYLGADKFLSIRAIHDLAAANLAENFASALDQNLRARIRALQMLTASASANDASRREDLYREAKNFHEYFGSHVVLADLDMRMLFNTRVPFGTPLPMLPRPKGRAAAPIAIETGQPAIGDMFVGPVAKEPLIAIAVPGMRGGKVSFIALTTLDTRLFTDRLNKTALPSGWSLAILDGSGNEIARRAPPDLKPAGDTGALVRFVAKSALSPWSVVLEIPRDVYRAPLVEAGGALAAAVVVATLASVLGGLLASRRLARSVASLANPRGDEPTTPDIAEIAATRRALRVTAESRETAEAALRESEQRFRAAFEHAAVGIAMVAPDGRWLRANQKLCDIVGCRHDELMERRYQDIVHPDDRDADQSQRRQLLAREIDACTAERRYIRRNGSPVWIRHSTSVVWRPDGSHEYFVSVIEDIQRRKEAERSHRSLFDNMLNGVAHGEIVLEDGRPRDYVFLNVNPAFETLTGLKDVIGRKVSEVVPGIHDLDTGLFEICGRVAMTGQPETFEIFVEAMQEWFTISAYCPNQGQFLAVFDRITERKKADEEIRRLNAGLERQVAERTAQLEAANKELDAFAYSASHDLRAPLQTIDGFAHALQEDYGKSMAAEALDWLERIRAASRRMAQLVDDLLGLSRVTRAGMARDAVDLSALARSIADELRARDPARNVAVEIAENALVVGDRPLLRVLLENLLSNAWKYTSKLPRARIEFAVAERDGERVFCVRDDGAGFDMAYAARLFLPFQRLHAASEFPGNGVGLATVERIARRHGGRVWAEGAPEKGAAFFFTISGAPGSV